MACAPAGYDVFLSYSRADAASAESLRARLRDAGIKAFLDRYALPGGKPWQPELEAALAGCRALVILLGPAGIGGWQHREIQLGLDRQTGAAKTATPFPVIPVLLPGLQPDDVPLGTFLALNTWVDLRAGIDEPEPLQRLIAAAQGQAIESLTRALAGLRPYRGLLAFREQDSGLFFGRERFVEELVAKVRQRSVTNLVAVLGRSGSGKSSVVFAGLLPALRREKGVVQEAVWEIISIRPTKEPLQALINAFDPPAANLGETETIDLLKERTKPLREKSVTVADYIERQLQRRNGSTRLLLYVDQWEELYTLAQPREVKTEEDKVRAADARVFVDLLLDAASKAPCTLVFTVRSDFYPDLQADDALRAAVQDCQVSLGPMSESELVSAIEGPAKAVGGSVDPELTKKLLRDIGLELTVGRDDHYDIGKLPLLEYALERAWMRAEQGRIELDHYRGLEQALEERANKIYSKLSPEQQAGAKSLFVSLVSPGEGREDTRARIMLSNDPLLGEVAEAFAQSDARLIVVGGETAGARSVEVSHEALIRHWDKLRAWIDENRANLRTRSALVADRDEWLKQNRDRSLLIEPGLRLEAARRLRDHPGDVTIADIRDYLDASFGADARRESRRQLAFAAIAATAVAMTGLASWGWYQFTEAERRADETTAALIWSRLDFEQTGDPSSEASVRALWDLATGTTALRDAFLRLLPRDRDLIDILTSSPASIGRAFGLHPDAQNAYHLLTPILDILRQTTDDRQLKVMTAAVKSLAPNITSDQAMEALGEILDTLRSTTEYDQIVALIQTVQIISPQLTPEHAQKLFRMLLYFIVQTPNAGELTKELLNAVEILSLSLPQEKIQSGIESLLMVLSQDKDGIPYQDTVETIFAMGPSIEQARSTLALVLKVSFQIRQHNISDIYYDRLPTLVSSNETATAALDPLIDAFNETGSTVAAVTLAQAVQTLGSKLTSEQAEAALGPLMIAIGGDQVRSPIALSYLGAGVRAIGPNLTSEHARTSLESLLNNVRRTTELSWIAQAQAVQGLGPRLAPVQAKAALQTILDFVRSGQIPREASTAAAIQPLGPTAEQANSFLAPLLSAIPTMTDEFQDGSQLKDTAEVVEILGPILTPDQARTALEPLLDAIAKLTSHSQFAAVTQAIRTLGPSLRPEGTQAAFDSIIGAIGGSPGRRCGDLAEVARTLGRILTPGQATATLDELIGAANKSTDPELLTALAKIVEVLGPDPHQLQVLLSRFRNTVDQDFEAYLVLPPPDRDIPDLEPLVQAVMALFSAPEAAQSALGPLLVSIRESRDHFALKALTQAVQILGPKLTAKQAQAVLGPMLDALREAIDSDREWIPFSRSLYLVQVVQALGTGLAQEAASAALDTLLWAFQRAEDSSVRHAVLQAIQVLGPKVASERAKIAIEVARTELANRHNTEASARAVAVTLAADPPSPYVASIVELLQWPTTAGPATDALLEVLHDRVPGAPGKEAGLDATVQWIAATYPDIDLDSPPTCPPTVCKDLPREADWIQRIKGLADPALAYFAAASNSALRALGNPPDSSSAAPPASHSSS